MEKNEEDELGDFIESSQVPTLRAKVRQNKPNYTIEKSPRKRSKKKPPKRFRDNKTVSQCLRQVWKKSPAKPSSGTATKQPSNEANVAVSEEECITFPPTQQQSPNGVIHPVPSVSMFAQQDNALARYICDGTTDAQVEEQLEKLLDGFQADYQQQCAGMIRSPVPCAEVERGATSQLTHLHETNMELEEIPAKESRENVAPLQTIIDLIPNISEEILRLEEMLKTNNSSQKNPSFVPASTSTPIIPNIELKEEIPQLAAANTAISIVTDNVCLDLSKQIDQSTAKNRVLTPNITAEERKTVNQNHSANSRNVKLTNSPRVDGVLDLRISNPQTIPHTVPNYSAQTIDPNRPLITATTADCGIQTNLRNKRRNVAVQHRPLASLELTDRNLIVLAQQFEADPSMLQRKLRRISKTSNEAIWRTRDLSTVFTEADPYYANLKHFM